MKSGAEQIAIDGRGRHPDGPDGREVRHQESRQHAGPQRGRRRLSERGPRAACGGAGREQQRRGDRLDECDDDAGNPRLVGEDPDRRGRGPHRIAAIATSNIPATTGDTPVRADDT